MGFTAIISLWKMVSAFIQTLLALTMRQAQLPPSTAKGAWKSNDTPQQTTTPSRFRASPRTKESSRVVEVVNEVPANRAKSVPPDLKNSSKAKRIIVTNKPKSSEDVVEYRKGKESEEIKVVGRSLNRQTTEQFSRTRRRPLDVSFKRNEDDPDRKNNVLQEKLELSENLVTNLQSEMLSLKAEIDKVKNLNVELESQNRKIKEDLAAAEAKLAATNSSTNQIKKESNGEQKSTKFKDIQKLIANKLERSMVKREAVIESNSVRVPSPPPPPPELNITLEFRTMEKRTPPCPPQLPPLPPPPPPQIPTRPLAKASNIEKPPAVLDLFQYLKKHDRKKDSAGSSVHHKAPVMYPNTHSSIVGEIQNRSTHLLAIRTDIETKGELINSLIQKVMTTKYTDIEDVIKFVDWLDGELSSLADERAVLKHFNWPERKADALREAAVEYRDIKMLEEEISSYRDEPSNPCGMALKKMETLLDKSEQSMQRLTRLRNSVLCSFESYRIPTAWMLETGIISKIKQSSISLAKLYIRRVTRELESVRNTDRESNQESLVLQGVNFAYRAHQFTGGLDSETLCSLEEIRRRVPAHSGGYQELLPLAGISST